MNHTSHTLFNDAPFPIEYENIRVHARINDTDSILDLTSQLPSRNIKISGGDSIKVPLIPFASSAINTQPGSNKISLWISTDNTPAGDTIEKKFCIHPRTHPLWEEVSISFSTYLTNTERLFLDIDQKHLKEANAKITDGNGNIMFTAKNVTKSIDIRDLQAGNYVLEISTSDGSRMRRLTIH